MTTVALLRTTYLNGILGRIEASTAPWTDTLCNQAIGDALTQLWPVVGKRSSGTVATNQSSDVYTIPTALQTGIIARIDLEQSSGGVSARVDKITRWTRYSDSQVQISPMLATDSTLTIRFHGWVPFDVTGSDLPTRLENVVAMKAAGLAYGLLAAQLVNSERQQGLDSGRVVDYQTAAAMSAYWERRYQDAIRLDINRVSVGPRAASR